MRSLVDYLAEAMLCVVNVFRHPDYLCKYHRQSNRRKPTCKAAIFRVRTVRWLFCLPHQRRGLRDCETGQLATLGQYDQHPESGESPRVL